MSIEVFGYSVTAGAPLLSLSEVTLVITPEEAESLGRFFMECAAGMNSSPNWEHKHFDGADGVQIIAFSAEKKALLRQD